MIVVKLLGGLGNQLFQYAAGRSLAEKHGVQIRYGAQAIGGFTDNTGSPAEVSTIAARHRDISPSGRRSGAG